MTQALQGGQENSRNRPVEHFEDHVSSQIHFFKSGSTIQKIDLGLIDYILAEGNYSKLIMGQKKIIISSPLKQVEKYLDNKEFIRIHRSCIVAIRKLDKIKDHVASVNNAALPIGKLYRDEFYNRILNY